jgi:hypothetical protein
MERSYRSSRQPQVIEDRRHRIRVRIHIEMHRDSEHSTGQIIDRPWLRLQALPPDTEHIGLGTIPKFQIDLSRDATREVKVPQQTGERVLGNGKPTQSLKNFQLFAKKINATPYRHRKHCI